METSSTAWAGIGIAPDLRGAQPANTCIVCGRGYDAPVHGAVAPQPGTCSAVCSVTARSQSGDGRHQARPRITTTRADELHGHGGW